MCSAALGILVYRFAEKLFSARAAFFALATVTALPAFAFTGFVVNPESPLAPLWVLYLLLLLDTGRSREPWRPFALGGVLGLAFLAKYTAILLLPITLAHLALTPQARHWFKRPAFYAGGFFALTLVSPVILWNHIHHWPSIQLHLVERVESASTTVFLTRLQHLIVGQILFFHPMLFPGLIGMAGWTLSRARRDDRFRLLSLAGAPVLLFFFAMMLRVKDAESHWPMVGYIALAVAAGAWLDQRVAEGSRWFRAYWRTALGVSGGLAAVYFLHTQSTFLMKRIPEAIYDPRVDAVNETFGWEDLAVVVAAHRERLGDRTVVVSSHNVLCGHLLIALDDRPAVYCASPQRTEFDFVARRLPPQDVPVLYIDTDRYPEDPAPLLGRACEHSENVDVMRGGRLVNRFRISVCAATPAVAQGNPSLSPGRLLDPRHRSIF